MERSSRRVSSSCCAVAGFPKTARLAAAPLLFLTVLAAGTACADTSCSDLCPGGSPCQINSVKIVEPGSEVACPGYDIELLQYGHLKVFDGDFVLIANSLTSANPNSLITAVAGLGGGRVGGIRLELTGDYDSQGSVQADSNKGGGFVEIEAGGAIRIAAGGANGVSANGLETDGGGGRISLEAGGDIVIADPVVADSAGSGEAAGGTIRIRAGGDLVTTGPDGFIRAEGHKSGGGGIELIAGDDVTLAALISVNGRQAAGDGGNLEVTATDVLSVTGAITARGGVNAAGESSRGGSVTIWAGCGGMTLGGLIDVRAADTSSPLGAGSVSVGSLGPVTFTASGDVDLRGTQAGARGGLMEVRSHDLVTMLAGSLLDARGDSAGQQGGGGEVSITACRIDLQSGATIDVSGYQGGRIAMQARKEPSASGAQPMYIRSGSHLFANADAAATTPGAIDLDPYQTKPGQCSTNGLIPCANDTDCPPAGCYMGHCLYANPDTDGEWSQFSIIPAVHPNKSLSLGCATTCTNN